MGKSFWHLLLCLGILDVGSLPTSVPRLTINIFRLDFLDTSLMEWQIAKSPTLPSPKSRGKIKEKRMHTVNFRILG